MAQRVGRSIALLFHDRGTRRERVVSSTPRPHFTPGKDPLPILPGAGWAPGPVLTGGKSRPHRNSIPDRPACSQSLYWLSYWAHLKSLKGHSNSALGYHNGDIFRFRLCACRFVGREFIYFPFNHNTKKKTLLRVNPALPVCVSNYHSSNDKHIIFTIVGGGEEGPLFEAHTLLSACHATLTHVGQFILPYRWIFCYLRYVIHVICTFPSCENQTQP